MKRKNINRAYATGTEILNYFPVESLSTVAYSISNTFRNF